MSIPDPEIPNSFLQHLPEADFAAFSAQLEQVTLSVRQILWEPNEPIEHLYFFHSGYASVVAVASSSRVEIGMIGSEGVVGLAAAFGLVSSPFQCLVQLAATASRINVADFLAVIDARPTLLARLTRFDVALQAQTAFTAFVNVEHTVEMRLARWLLMCHDRARTDEFAMTHEFLASMLGVRRAGVTTALHVLEGHKAIKAKRGWITILDRDYLIDLTDGIYGLPEAEYERLMAVA